MTRTLLIDADIIAYQVSAAAEDRVDWGGGVVSVETDFEGAKDHTRATIEEYLDTLEADRAILCLSDDFRNFRKTVDPTYKTNRSGTVRPELLYDVKDWMTETFEFDRRPYLEADDVMGILATEPHDGERIIVSEDKDMLTVPAPLYRPHKPILGIVTSTPEEAERFMLWQALTGDAVDGYKGCPGCGPVMADKVLDGLMWQEETRVMKSGPRKGQEVTEWVSYECDSSTPWERIVAIYAKSGLTEADAIRQVNLARILKHTDYDGNRVIPWVPN